MRSCRAGRSGTGSPRSLPRHLSTGPDGASDSGSRWCQVVGPADLAAEGGKPERRKLRGEVAYLLGLAAALDKYEHAPHDEHDGTPPRARVSALWADVPHRATR